MNRAHSVVAGLAQSAAAIPATLLVALPGLAFIQGFDGLGYGLGLMAGVVLAAVLIPNRSKRTPVVGVAEFLLTRFGMPVVWVGSVAIAATCLLLLIAEIRVGASVIHQFIGVRYDGAVIGVALFMLAVAALHDHGLDRSARAGLGVAVVLGLVVPLWVISFERHGPGVPFLSFGHALAALGQLETQMLESGAADLRVFKATAQPFISVDEFVFLGTVLSLFAGGAVLSRLTGPDRSRSPRTLRTTAIWNALISLVALMSVPALAIYAKLSVYEAIVAGTPVTAVPAGFAKASEHDLVRIHGVSVALIEDARGAVQAGHRDPTSVGTFLRREGRGTFAAWIALKPQVRKAIVDAVAGVAVLNSEALSDAWMVLQTSVLPVAASAQGNKSRQLVHSSLSIEPAALPLLLPALTSLPGLVTGFIVTSLLAAALATASALALALGETVAVISHRRSELLVAALVISLAAAVALFVTLNDTIALAIGAFSIAGGALLPALLLGLWWKRASALAAFAAITVGLIVSAYYQGVATIAPASFYETWSRYSNASEASARRFVSLARASETAGDDDAKAQASLSLEELARGTVLRPGLANWFGIPPAMSAVFSLPLGFLTLVVVSFLPVGRRRGAGKALTATRRG